MGTDGRNKVRLIRKKSETAIKEFKVLANYLNDILSLNTNQSVKFNSHFEAVEIEMVIDDRNFFFERCIVPTVLNGQPVKCWNDLKFSPADDRVLDACKAELCKKFDCWLECDAWYNAPIEANQYFLFDNNGNRVGDVRLDLYNPSTDQMEDWKVVHEKAGAAMSAYFDSHEPWTVWVCSEPMVEPTMEDPIID